MRVFGKPLKIINILFLPFHSISVFLLSINDCMGVKYYFIANFKIPICYYQGIGENSFASFLLIKLYA